MQLSPLSLLPWWFSRPQDYDEITMTISDMVDYVFITKSHEHVLIVAAGCHGVVFVSAPKQPLVLYQDCPAKHMLSSELALRDQL